jgi:hypothetical protein
MLRRTVRRRVLIVLGVVVLVVTALVVANAREMVARKPRVVGVATLPANERIVVWQRFNAGYTTYLSHQFDNGRIETFVIRPSGWKWDACTFRVAGDHVIVQRGSNVETFIDTGNANVYQESVWGIEPLFPVELSPTLRTTLFDAVTHTHKRVELELDRSGD